MLDPIWEVNSCGSNSIDRAWFQRFRDTPSPRRCTAYLGRNSPISQAHARSVLTGPGPGGGIGRRAGFRCQWLNGREGSSPFLGTTCAQAYDFADMPGAIDSGLSYRLGMAVKPCAFGCILKRHRSVGGAI